MQVLIVEDEEKISNILSKCLLAERYNVDTAKDGKEALGKISVNKYDLVVLDLIIPYINGMVVCKSIRIKDPDTPILMLTAKSEIADKIEGLDAGADDYMTKPFSIDEFTARVRALLRRGKEAHSSILSIEDLTLNPATKIVKRNNKDIVLTAREYALLVYFMRHKNIVLSKEQILNNVWDYSYEGMSNVVETYVRYLRNKLKNEKDSKELIHTVKGLGYIMKE